MKTKLPRTYKTLRSSIRAYLDSGRTHILDFDCLEDTAHPFVAWGICGTEQSKVQCGKYYLVMLPFDNYKVGDIYTLQFQS